MSGSQSSLSPGRKSSWSVWAADQVSHSRGRKHSMVLDICTPDTLDTFPMGTSHESVLGCTACFIVCVCACLIYASVFPFLHNFRVSICTLLSLSLFISLSLSVDPLQ